MGLVPKHLAKQPLRLPLFLLWNLASLTPTNTASRTFSVNNIPSTFFFSHITPRHTFCNKNVTISSCWDEMKLFCDTTVSFSLCACLVLVYSLYHNLPSSHPTHHSFPLNATIPMAQSNPNKKPTTVTNNAQKKDDKTCPPDRFFLLFFVITILKDEITYKIKSF